MNKAASIKASLMNIAQKEKRSYQELLQTYVLERVVCRLSVSSFAEMFALKGGILLYALFDGQFARATADIDLLCEAVSTGKDRIDTIFHQILALDMDDGLVFDPSTVSIADIAEHNVFPGVRVMAQALLERTRVPVTIDIGFGDEIVPEHRKIDFPSLLEGKQHSIRAYSTESVIAEKLEAIASLGFLNSRYKDFFDIYLLAQHFPFHGEVLVKAVKTTFTNRKTTLYGIAAFGGDFVSDPLHQKRWNAFIKKKAVFQSKSLLDTINNIRHFIQPVIDAIEKGAVFNRTWDYKEQEWK